MTHKVTKAGEKNSPNAHPVIRVLSADGISYQQQSTIDSDPSEAASNSSNPWIRLDPDIWSVFGGKRRWEHTPNIICRCRMCVDMLCCVRLSIYVFTLHDKIPSFERNSCSLERKNNNKNNAEKSLWKFLSSKQQAVKSNWQTKSVCREENDDKQKNVSGRNGIPLPNQARMRFVSVSNFNRFRVFGFLGWNWYSIRDDLRDESVLETASE